MAEDKIKAALKMMPYGFYAFTTKDGGDVNAMVVNWVSQMSYAPRLVAVGIQKSCYSRGLVEAGGVFGLNLFLQADSDAIMGVTSGRARKPDKMENADYSAAPETGVPVLAGAAAYIECKLTQIVDVGGDHDIVVGEAIHADVMKEGAPPDVLSLTELGWSYAG
ncbi:MAG: flavin reductase family protein [Chloroflexi bacterium]|nr:flavin reductase family protein [Chloroflexota bacterium]MCY3583674.1 flavin reductase family protein [Chloroflexota bacterium]MCY3716954.1 flavin reductase family protein [Chloroflexota bacterium]MDE2650138.1 flavin reductase family protein [Chloroflexota bacterium]MXV92852.1 flavin reductase family protein [Chloroflexota bacterium]